MNIIVNEYITEIIINNLGVIINNDLGLLGPPPQMIRSHSLDDSEEVPLIFDGSFQDFQDYPDFVMPEAFENCYTFLCNGLCFEEVPAPALSRILTNAHLPDDEDDEDEDEEVDK
jgi:hypothetical protein